MNLLLDTHTLIWVLANEPTLSSAARKAIEDPDSRVFVSAVTAWEIAIKRSLGKLRAPENYLDALKRYRFTSLDISTEHALAVEHLPHHHHDPFDRLLVAQAQILGVPLVSGDHALARYDITVLWEYTVRTAMCGRDCGGCRAWYVQRRRRSARWGKQRPVIGFGA